MVVDVDGTITFRDRSLDCRAVEALRSLRIPVVVATGNVLCFAGAVSTLLGTRRAVIAENGGVVEYERVEFDASHLKECEQAFDFLKERFALEKLDPEYRKTEVALRRNFDVDKAGLLLSDFKDVEIIDTGFAVHIKSRGINKGTGLKRIAEMMGLDPGDFAAIGDSPNDIEMLKTSGFGIAVGNAHPEVKKVAALVTKGEHGAGVAEAVRYLKERGEII